MPRAAGGSNVSFVTKRPLNPNPLNSISKVFLQLTGTDYGCMVRLLRFKPLYVYPADTIDWDIGIYREGGVTGLHVST